MIVVFGSINLDLVATAERLPAPGETVLGREASALPGGKGANQALAARRAGAEVAMVGCVGRDDFADTALATLELAGVDLRTVRRVDAPTGLALIAVDDAGENQIVVAPGANGALDDGALDEETLRRAGVLLLQREVDTEAGRRVAERASGAGVRVVLNAAPAAGFTREELRSVDLLVVNAHELETAADAFGLPAGPLSERLEALTRAAAIDIVATLGGEGALACVVESGSPSITRCAAPAIDVVDTTGAGDAFVGSLAAALDRGEPIGAALRYGVAAGSLACTALGAQSAAPAHDRIEAIAETLGPASDA